MGWNLITVLVAVPYRPCGICAGEICSRSTPEAATSVPIHDMLGVGLHGPVLEVATLLETSPGVPGSVFLLSGIRVGILGTDMRHIYMYALAPGDILVAGKVFLGPQLMFLLMTKPEMGMQSLAPGADSLLALLAQILVLTPRQPTGYLAKMPLQINTYRGFTINL